MSGLTVGDIASAIGVVGPLNADMPVHATTPHRSYRFEITAVENEGDVVLLHLRDLGVQDHYVVVDELAWHLEHPMACRDAGLPDCRLTGLVQVGVEAGHVVMGRSRVWLDEAGVLLWDDPEPLEVTKL